MVRIILNAITGGFFIGFGISWITGGEAVREDWLIASVLIPALIFAYAIDHILIAIRRYLQRKLDLEFHRLSKKHNENRT